ncbi:DUF3786 domain-containing protein [Thermodesulforhabdus norvegica]|uniref:Putative signal transducing protein n=1 Tax=Thermodesulforhabdus norvegica TaxID=39841 RepID=A0A1I4TPM6_9BACT|nr:DUF3786 domain-containing protein [Thermodesulforhabdus norvegica]SFM78625.1 Putative signal transducing protein [Thermodesulforhabdus norvegica]
MDVREKSYVTVYTLANRFEADIVAHALEQENIPFWIRSFEDTAYDGLFVVQKGWGHVLVPRQHYHNAIRIIYALLKNQPRKGLYEDPDEVDPALWDELLGLSADDVCRASGAEYDKLSGSYRVPFFNRTLVCNPERRIIEVDPPFSALTVDFETALVGLNYLINAEPVEPLGKWVGEKDLPGGFVFFQGPHQLPTRPLAEMFQMNPEDMEKAVEFLGGVRGDKGDCSYVFRVFPRVPVMVIFWEGDEEFDPQAALRFDETITRHFPVLDQIFALSYVLYRHIKGALKEIGGTA